MTHGRGPYQGFSIILLTLFIGGGVLFGALAYSADREQRDEIQVQQEISMRAICTAALVIQHEPRKARAADQGETEAEFMARLRSYRVFISGAIRLGCPGVFAEP